MISSSPRSLGKPDMLSQRLELARSARAFAPLAAWIEQLRDGRARSGLMTEVPLMDPAEAGFEARVLLLMEAPGPMTNTSNARRGSGFVSSDNDDATAHNLWNARQSAGLHHGSLLWNLVPWYLGPARKKPAIADVRQGAEHLRELITLLPELHTVVTLGLFARKGWTRFGRPNVGIALRTIDTWHPSQLAMNQAGKREHLEAALTRANRDWRNDREAAGEVQIDHDRQGAPVAHWYSNRDGDRIDLHPRWW
ncbi:MULTISPECIES: uracil-DNA glycosylase [unclassified Salinibacterium]|uniref:uracil-DNA glycosylase n=1 Tax=unclassified Salinibacterium TaxID=2632331 RepID=UPI0027DA1C7F|nr:MULTISPECIES: uracil-DNA glycosylase [unclassified Salinibacterium]